MSGRYIGLLNRLYLHLFGCFTGLSYIDIKTLTNEHFETDKDGRRWIKKKRVKTNVLSRIPVLPMAQSILDKYSGGKKMLPLQDATDIYRNIKDIAVLCGIDKRVCFHTSRHTYRGKTYFAEDFGDVGSLGDRKFSIFKWNDEKKRYNLLAEML